MTIYTFTMLDDPLAGPFTLFTDDTWAAGINNTGDIVGYYGFATGLIGGTGTYDYIYSEGTYTTLISPNVFGSNVGGVFYRA